MPVELLTAEIVGRATAMACDVTVRLVPGAPSGAGETAATGRDVQHALDVFGAVERACTRFDPDSPLMRANARPGAWTEVPAECFDALLEAYWAYRLTGGRFEPRVLTDLVRLGYAESSTRRPLGTGADARDVTRRDGLPPWEPQFRPGTREVLLGDLPVDLGGIGKGLAVRWASERLGRLPQDARRGYLVEAGGDCFCAGEAPEGGPWRVAVEDPSGGSEPLAVLGVQDAGCATSSVRVRRWLVDGKQVHHLVDPRTGRPGGNGLLAVTIVDPDPARAEVWSKTLFLEGADGIAAVAAERGLAALWVEESGALSLTETMTEHVLWTAA